MTNSFKLKKVIDCSVYHLVFAIDHLVIVLFFSKSRHIPINNILKARNYVNILDLFCHRLLFSMISLSFLENEKVFVKQIFLK